MKKHFVSQFALTIFILFVLVFFWEFFLEGPLTGEYETTAERWKFVVTVLAFGSVALVIPSIIGFRFWKKYQKAREEIKVLKGIIPVCMYCHKMKSDKGDWDKLEKYLAEHSSADLSHGVCPECYEKQLGELDRDE